MPTIPKSISKASSQDATKSLKKKTRDQLKELPEVLSMWIEESSGTQAYGDPWNSVRADADPRGNPNAKI
ncbi:uncharacterized protein CTRU02_209846 [Colletotrichum truncatum]|uniref:Uncharacterized protein n=1 Tax=Colletotrichum truncatum TaxID=5467 RepID=A0ACC3YTI5_COLTU